MLLSDLKNRFLDILKNVFSEKEIESIFFILTREYLEMSRLEVALNPRLEISEKHQALFEKALERLSKHEPVQYIIGKTEFYGRNFKVNSNVLIPRPETEELVDWIVNDNSARKERINILDIGTGSGCIAISLAKELPFAEVSAFDISDEALLMARDNAKLNDADVIFREIDILKESLLDPKFNIIVSNPPYVRIMEKEEMHRNVLDHEPFAALFVENDDPLLFYRKITSLAWNSMLSGGKLYFEINQYLPEETLQLVKEFGFEAELKKDIFGNYRMLKAIKH